MDYIPVLNTCQAELTYLWDGQRVQTVLHYTKATPWDVTDLQEAAEDLINTWNVNLKSRMPATISLVEVTCFDLSSQTGPSYTSALGLPLMGALVGSSLPNNVAMVVTKRTALRGRSYRGRIYHPGLTENVVIGNTVDASWVVLLVNAYKEFMSVTLTADEGLLVVVSKYTGKNPRFEGVATLVTNLTSDGVIDSQRRRLPGRGA